MSIPKEPRQMMINMMYLVLTALLAMNVSAEILNAFHTVNRGISNSNISVDSKIGDIQSTFQTELNNDPKRVTPLKIAADSTHAQVQRLVGYIENLKNLLITASNGWTDTKGVKHADGKGWSEEAGTLEKHDDLESTTRIFIEDEKAPQAPILEKKIQDTRNAILNNLSDPADKSALAKSIPLRIDKPLPDDEGETKSWEDANFHMVPTIATLTLLNKFINDAKNSEAQINERLINKITQKIMRVDQLQAKVISPSSYVLDGQPYSAQIFVAASSSTQDPTIYLGALSSAAVKDADGNYKELTTNPVVGGTKMSASDVQKGVGSYKTVASGEGEHPLTGAIEVNDNGVMKYYPFDTKWQSAKAAVVISPTKMNVFYIGVPNPVDISIPGIASDRIQPSITQGSISPDPTGKGKYIVTVSTQGKCNVNVSAKLGDNNTKPMGGMEFRVKRIPDPMGLVGTIDPGGVPATTFRAQAFVLAVLRNFDFDAKFTVTSFSMTYAPRHKDLQQDVQSNGTKMTEKMQGWVGKCMPGDLFYIDDIHVKGPDGSIRKLTSVSYKIN